MNFFLLIRNLGTMLLHLLLFSIPVAAQTYDTIANWEGITQNWQIVAGTGSGVADNPAAGGINTSPQCFKIVTTANKLDFFSYTLPQHPDFNQFPYYNLKVLAPQQGGDVLLKFENSNATDVQEIKLTPTPGVWNNLIFDFSGRPFKNYTRMVIFADFQGTIAGRSWYFDDITRTIPGTPELQSNLPIVVINTFGEYIPDEPKVTGHMGIIDNGPGNLNTFGDPFNNYDGWIGIEVRGESTQMFPKKSYALETRDSTGENLNASLLGFPEENDWILYAPYTDKSMMRNFISFFMSNKLSGYHSRMKYCELIVNNNYKGVYVLMEKIKKDKNRVDIATLNPDEISGDDVTGGYILKVDKIDPGFSYTTDGWRSSVTPPYASARAVVLQFEYPDPEEIVTQQRTYIRNFVTEAEKALISPNFKDPDKGYQKYFDVASFIDFMLVCEISKEVDKYRYSTFFHKDKESNGGKLCAGPAWDFNLGYGNVDYWPPGINYSGWLYPMSNLFGNDWIFWWKRMMEDTYFRDLAKTRWMDIRQNILTDAALNHAIDSVKSWIAGATVRNFERWPILGQYVWPNYNWQNNDFEDEVNHFRSFLTNRLHWMDSNFPGQPLQRWSAIRATGNRIILDLYGDYFRHPFPEPRHFLLNEAPGLQIAEVEYLSASVCMLFLSGNPALTPGMSVTVNASILNGFHDLTSNKLSATGVSGTEPESSVRVYTADGNLHIRCNDPEGLPGAAELFDISGRRTGCFPLEKIRENILPLELLPGVYVVALRNDAMSIIRKIMVY